MLRDVCLDLLGGDERWFGGCEWGSVLNCHGCRSDVACVVHVLAVGALVWSCARCSWFSLLDLVGLWGSVFLSVGVTILGACCVGAGMVAESVVAWAMSILYSGSGWLCSGGW